MSRLEAILFDIDGTLVNSNDMHAQCWVEAFEHFGVKVPWDTIRGQIGKGGDLLVPDTLNARQMREFGKPLKEYRSKRWQKDYMPSVKPFPGVPDALRELHERGLEISFASSSDPNEVEFYVRLLGIEAILEATTSKGDAKFSKPSPEIFDAAIDQSGSNDARTIVVGDTPYDILAAHRAALPVAAVLCGGFPRETLSKAEFIFDDVPSVAREIDRIDAYFRH